MNKTQRGGLGRRAVALVGALALALIGTAAIGTAASAADAAPSPSNITGTTGTLTIHKHAGDPGPAGNGTVITDPAKIAALGAGLVGVEFSVQRVSSGGVPINLTTAAGWDIAQTATPANVSVAPFSLDAGTPATTGAGGIAVVPNLPYGLYLVTETSPGANPIVSPVQPFLVSVPYPDATNSTWLYDVHVYPKNKLNTTVPTKTVSAPDGLTLGSSVVWTVTAPVPALGAGGTYSKFIVTDSIDPRLQLTGIVVKSDGVVVGETPAGYTRSGDVVVTFNPLARQALVAGTNVTIEYTTKVISLGDDGTINNQGFVNVNDSVRETELPQTNWGPLTIVKKAAQAPNNTLAGAEFTLHETKGGPVLATYTTNASGEIVVDGLWVGNGGVLTKDYWLHETKAPAGYVLPAGDAAWSSTTVTAGNAASAVPVTINNTQQNGPNLPLTGSTGTAMFMAGGIALLLTAGGVALVASSRKRQGTAK